MYAEKSIITVIGPESLRASYIPAHVSILGSEAGHVRLDVERAESVRVKDREEGLASVVKYRTVWSGENRDLEQDRGAM